MAAGGKIRLEITCADVPGFLEKLTKEGISLRDVEQVDALTIVCSVRKSDFSEIGNLAEKCGLQIMENTLHALIFSSSPFSAASSSAATKLSRIFPKRRKSVSHSASESPASARASFC